MNKDLTANQNNFSEELGRAHRELTVLYEISNAMRTTLELNHILFIILTGVTAHTGLGFNRAILFLVNPMERCLEPKMAIGPESGEHAHKIWEHISKSYQHFDDLIKEDLVTQNINQSSFLKSVKNLKIPLDPHANNLLSHAYHQGSPRYITQEKIAEYQEDILLQYFKTNELVIMPLKAKDKVKGLIVADNLFTQKPITEDELKIFMMLANQAGLAIENSQLYEMVIQQSRTDSITNLWNHGFFQDQLSSEIVNVQKNHSELTLVLIDIDNFKDLNDTYGHQNGDIILKELANILKDSSRENDYVCRYGGDEFSFILTQTSSQQGYIIAERIRQRIENHHFPQFSSKQTRTVSVSIGLATFPLNAKTKEELIMKADKAMYIAKFSGKNQTHLTQEKSP